MREPGLTIIGAHGRMGRRLVALSKDYELTVAAEVDRDGPALDAELASYTRAVIDFSAPDQTAATLAWCKAHHLPLVLGTTGLGSADLEAIDVAAKTIPLVFAANFSLGVHTLLNLVGEAARILEAARWDIELVETHHKRKVDAPSGTALALLQRIAAARHTTLDECVHGREGQVGARPVGQLGVHAVRGGSIVGEHQIRFLGEGEELVLEHRATDRDIFVRGALHAASWLLAGDRGPGRYGLGDVLSRD